VDSFVTFGQISNNDDRHLEITPTGFSKNILIFADFALLTWGFSIKVTQVY